MDKKTKKILVITSVVMIVVAIGILLTRSVPPTTSTEGINSSFEDTTVDGLRFSNIKMVGNQLTAIIQNTLSSKTSIKSIIVKFYDKNNNEIESVDAYVGSKFEANEMKSLDVKTDADLSNLGNVTYEVNRSSCVITKSTGVYTRSTGANSSNYYYTGSYQCNGITGYINKCYVSGSRVPASKYGSDGKCCGANVDGSYTNLLVTNHSNGSAITWPCTSNNSNGAGSHGVDFNGWYSQAMYTGNLPSQIECSCEE